MSTDKKSEIKQKFTAKEWNASGAFQFYGSKKPRSYIYEVTMTEEVNGDPLQKAVDTTLKRMPYLKSTFVRKKGLYYYADNDLPLTVAESDKPRTLGNETTNYHYIDVTFYGKKISFAMFHGLCDGFGLNRFVETTLYYYFCIKDNKKYSNEGLVMTETEYDKEEGKDVFAQKIKVSLKELKALAEKQMRFHLPEISGETDQTVYRYPLKIKTDELISWCKTNLTSPTAAVSAIMMKAVLNENNVTEGVIMSVAPLSLRKFMNAEKTFKNCSSAIFMPATPEECGELSVAELATKLRKVMKEQMNEKFALLQVAAINTIMNLGKKMPTFSLKNKIMSIKEKNPQDTFMVDYVGTIKTNDYSDRIKEINILNPAPSKGSLMIMMHDVAGEFHFNFNQTFDDPKYYKAFIKVVNEIGISCREMPRDSFCNPEIELPQE